MANGDLEIGQNLGLALRGIIDRLSGRQEDVLRTQRAAQRIQSGESREDVLTPEIARAAERSQVGSIGTALGKIPGFEQVPVLGRVARTPQIFERDEEGGIVLPGQRRRGRLIRGARALKQAQDPQTGEIDINKLSEDQLDDLSIFTTEDAQDFAEFLGFDTGTLSEIEKKLPADVFARRVARRDPETAAALAENDAFKAALKQAKTPEAQDFAQRLETRQKELENIQKEITELREDLRDPEKAILSKEEIRRQLAERSEDRERLLERIRALQERASAALRVNPIEAARERLRQSRGGQQPAGQEKVGEFTIRQVR